MVLSAFSATEPIVRIAVLRLILVLEKPSFENPKAKWPVWLTTLLLLGGLALVNIAFVSATPILRDRVLRSVRRVVGLEPRQGFISRTFFDQDGSAHSYMVFLPDPIHGVDHRPVLLYLNGHGQNGKDGMTPLKNGLAHAIWEDERNFPFVVIWPQCAEGDAWNSGSPSTKRALAILQEVAAEYRTDPDRVYLSGISSGGTGTWALAAAYPSLFAAILPISALTNEMDVKRVAQARIPVWSDFVNEDGAELTHMNRKMHRVLLEAGFSPHLTEVSTQGDVVKDAHDAWTFAYRDGGMYRWLANQKRGVTEDREPHFKLLDLTSTVEPQRLIAERGAPFGAEVSVLAGVQEPLRMTAPELTGPGLKEVHLEFRATGKVQRFGVGLFHPESSGTKTDVMIDIAVHDLNSSGLYSWPDRKCLAAAGTLSEQAYYFGGWNDLRLKFEQGQITAELNGWKMHDAVPVNATRTGSVLGFVAQGESAESVNVRNLRVRRDGSNAPLHAGLEPKHALPVNPAISEKVEHESPVSLASIVEAWKSCESSHPQVEIAWSLDSGIRFASSSFRSTERTATEVATPHSSRLTLTPEQLHISTPWRHARIDLNRQAGLRNEASLQDFQRIRSARFADSSGRLPDSSKLAIAIDHQSRIDTVSAADGRGYRGIVFDRPDVWIARVGELDDLIWRGPLLALRPLAQSGIGFQAENGQVLPDSVWVSGTRCRVIEETTQVAGSTYLRRFWVDPSEDFQILRHTVSVDGHQREQLDIQYSQAASHDGLPVSWDAVTWPRRSGSISDYQFSGNEWLFQAATCRTIAGEVKESATSATHALRFRPETVGFDQRRKEWFQQVATDKRRTLSAEEARTLVMSGNTTSDESSRVDRVIGAGLLLLLAVWVAIRRFRGRGEYAR